MESRIGRRWRVEQDEDGEQNRTRRESRIGEGGKVKQEKTGKQNRRRKQSKIGERGRVEFNKRIEGRIVLEKPEEERKGVTNKGERKDCE